MSDQDENPEFANAAMLALGRRAVFEAYEAGRFSDDRSYRIFAGNMLKSMGYLNPVDSHAQLYDSVLMAASEVHEADRRRGCPDALDRIGPDQLGLAWMDHRALERQFGMSNFSELFPDGLLFRQPVLCDPYYGIAIFQHEDRWRHVGFIYDWVLKYQRVLGDHVKFYLEDPSRSLSEGPNAARFFWNDLISETAQRSLQQNLIADIPIYSFEQLVTVAKALEDAVSIPNSQAQLWYRGQAREYLMTDRTDAVKAGFLQHSNVRDPSLVTSLYRQAHDFVTPRSRYRKRLMDLMAWEEAAESIFGPAWVDVPLGEAFAQDAFGDGVEFTSDLRITDEDGTVVGGRTRHTTFAKSAWQRGLLLQHYGCPSPFLDVTASIEIAHWFATHRFEGGISDSPYTAHSWSGDQPESWPTIYCFILNPRMHPLVESSKLNAGGVSERAKRQACALLGGGGLLVRNYAARFVGLRLRLHPDLAGCSKLKTEDLFPRAQDDSVFRELRNLNALGSENQFPLYGLT